MPRKYRCAGDSIASTTPSGATALAINDGAMSLTDWWCELFTRMVTVFTIRRSKLPEAIVTAWLSFVAGVACRC